MSSRVIFNSSGILNVKDRKVWILSAIETKDLEFLRILTQTVGQTADPFINTCEYLQFSAGIENNIPVIKHLLSLNGPIDHAKVLISAVGNNAFNNLKFFHEKMEFPIDDNYQLFNSAAGAEDNIPILEYLMSLNCPIDQLKALISAVENKAFNNLKFLHEEKRFQIDDNYRVFSSAAGIKNNIEIMEYLKLHNCPISVLHTTVSATENGALDNMKWLLKNGFFLMISSEIFEVAMESGSLEALKWLKDNIGCPIEKKPIDSSLENCSIETIEWLIVQGWTINATSVFKGAARHGCLDKMKWLLKKKYSIKDPEIFVSAVKHGSLKNLKWLLKNGCSIDDSDIFVEAARQGNFDIMKWLLYKCPIYDYRILDAAAEFGSIKQMKWLLSKSWLSIKGVSIFHAAEKGNVELMEWLLEKGCPIDRAMHGAAEHGCLTIMKWLLKKGCPIDDYTLMDSAAKYGSLRNMKWLLENGCPILDSDYYCSFMEATRHGSLDMMKWLLLDNGCPISMEHPGIMSAAVEYGSLVNMKWLLKNGCPMRYSNIFTSALSYGSLRNIKWLLDNRCPVDEYQQVMVALMFGSFEKLLQLLPGTLFWIYWHSFHDFLKESWHNFLTYLEIWNTRHFGRRIYR